MCVLGCFGILTHKKGGGERVLLFVFLLFSLFTNCEQHFFGLGASCFIPQRSQIDNTVHVT